MLRVLLIVLALANLGYLAWTRGWLDDVVGVRAAGDREPERIQRQLQPELVRVLPPDPAGSAAPTSPSAPAALPAGRGSSGPGSLSASFPAAAGEPLACLEAGPFAEDELAAAEAALAAVVPAGGWSRLSVDGPGEWLVYIGRFATADALGRTEDELKRRNVEYERTTSPSALEPGLALGRYADRASADAALAGFRSRGVDTARVVAPEAVAGARMLRVDHADAALAGRLAGLGGRPLGDRAVGRAVGNRALGGRPLGAGFVACADR